MKRFSACLLTILLILSCSFNVCAAGIDVTDSPVTGTVPSGFNADESIIGAGAVVTLPATLNLVYNESYDTFYSKDTVTTSGSINDASEVVIDVPESVTYTGLNTSATVKGFVKFGNDCRRTWNSSQVTASDTEDILIQVSPTDVTKPDDYSATVNFVIKTAIVGMCHPVNIPTPATELKGTPYTSSDDRICTRYVFNSSNALDMPAINLNGLDGWCDCFTMSVDTVFPNNSTVKYIELSESSKFLGVSHFFVSSPLSRPVSYAKNDMYSNYLSTWIMGLKGLQVIVVPEGITSEQLHNSYNKMTELLDFSYHDKTLIDTGETVGDATFFVKDIDAANNKWIYVPNIVYRGTMEEWKALSLYDDWQFNNAANLVTVHCADGKLYY